MAYGDWSVYEWDVERVTTRDTADHEEGEVIDHHFQESAMGCIECIKNSAGDGLEWRIVLVLDTQDGRSWAYVDPDEMTLDTHLEDAYGKKTRKVPRRFHDELAKALK